MNFESKFTNYKFNKTSAENFIDQKCDRYYDITAILKK
jgi:hypothetical protein